MMSNISRTDMMNLYSNDEEEALPITNGKFLHTDLSMLGSY